MSSLGGWARSRCASLPPVIDTLVSVANNCVCFILDAQVLLEGMVQLNKQTYAEFLEAQHGIAGDGPITDFVSRRDGRLMLGDRIDLNALAARYGAPLEVAF